MLPEHKGVVRAEKSVEGNGTQGRLRALSSLGNHFEVSVLYLLGYTEGPTMAPRIIVATIPCLVICPPSEPKLWVRDNKKHPKRSHFTTLAYLGTRHCLRHTHSRIVLFPQKRLLTITSCLLRFDDPSLFGVCSSSSLFPRRC